MRKIYLLILSTLLINSIYAQRGQEVRNWCKVVDSIGGGGHDRLKNLKTNTGGRLNDPDGRIIIPVVFHILYHPSIPAENISDQKINEQISRLNTDLRKLNSDIGLIPYQPWANIAADFKIEFKLACIDPNGNPTNGIKRIITNRVGEFGFPPVFPELPFYDAQLSETDGFGDDAWDPETYLNIWVCDLESDGGWAMLPWKRFDTPNPIYINGNPHDRAEFDGVILDYVTVGENGPVPYFDRGRVGVHEVGHWLGLYHTFDNNCFADGDYVTDTPPTNSNSDCPSFPHYNGCNSTFPGTMFMNYMDYTTDDCKYMFTEGQKTRARSFFSQTGPLGTRYPFLENYFSIKEFPSTPVIVQNNLITVYVKNPACLNVTYSFTGPVTEVGHNDHKIIFSVACPSSGTVTLTASAENYIDDYSFDFVNSAGCNVTAWPKLFEGKAFCSLLKDNTGNIFAWLGNMYNFSTNVNHIGPLPIHSPAGAYVLQYSPVGLTNWVKPDASPLWTLSTGELQVADIFSNPFYNAVTGNSVSPPSPLTVNERVIAEVSASNYITTTKNGNNDVIHSANSSINLGGTIIKTFFNPANSKLFVITISNSTYMFRQYNWSGGTLNLYLPNQSSFSNSAYPIAMDNSERIYMIVNDRLQEYLYNAAVPSFVPVASISGFTNANIAGPNSSTISDLVSNRCFVINTVEKNIYCIDFGSSISKKMHFSFDPMTEIIFQSNLIDGDNVYISGSINTSGTIGLQSIPFLGITPFETTLFLAKFSLNGEFSFRMQGSATTPVMPKENLLHTSVFPNPVTNNIRIVVNEALLSKKFVYTVIVFDQMKNKVLKIDNCRSGCNIDISSLRPGVYFLEIVNAVGERGGNTFIKL